MHSRRGIESKAKDVPSQMPGIANPIFSGIQLRQGKDPDAMLVPIDVNLTLSKCPRCRYGSMLQLTVITNLLRKC